MIGILNEKSSQAEHFAKALGGKHGTFNGQEYVIVHAHGHLYQYKEPSEMVPKGLHDKYKSWDTRNLPWNYRDLDFSYRMIPGSSRLLNEINSALSQCSEIVIATDDDPSGEGEKLAWEILSELNLSPAKWSRMYFSDEAVSSVRSAFDKRVPKQSMKTDPDMIEAVFRARWDLMSMPWTRIATEAVNNQAVLRQGRLKTAIVVIIGQQFDKIKAYKKIPSYCEKYRDENGNVFSNPNSEMVKDKNMVKLDAPSTITIDKRTKKHQEPPKMYDLTDLSTVLASKGIPSGTTLKTYQKMYEAQVLSYPRTENKIITPEQFKELVSLAPRIARVVGVDPKLLTHLTPRKKHVGLKEKIGKQMQAVTHGANRPGPNVPASLDDLDQKYGRGAKLIYTILAKNALATLAPDYEYEQDHAFLNSNKDFVATTNLPLKNGYKDVFTGDDTLELGHPFKGMAKPFIYTGYPPKPVTPTMKWLYNQLNKYHVGTGATQVSTYADVSNPRSKYPLLKDTRGKCTLTQYGEWSYKLMQGTKLADLAITAQLNDRMQLIRSGKAGWKEMGQWLDEESELVMHDLPIIQGNGINLRKEAGIKGTAESDRVKGQWQDENGHIVDVAISRVWRGHTWSDSELKALFAGQTLHLNLKSKSGSSYAIDAKLGHYQFKNSQGKIVKGIWVGGTLPERKEAVPDEFCHHKFTDSEKFRLEHGETIFVDNLLSKKGKLFPAYLSYGTKTYKGHKFKGIIMKFNK